LKLDDLVAEVRGLDLEAFRSRHKEAALLFPTSFGLSPDLSATRVDTPSQGMALGKGAQKPGGRPSPVVFFLAKTGKNPFGNMITLGRATNNDVCLPLSSVSKLHAYFTELPSGWSLSDGNATNGTFVADKRLAPGASAALKDGVTVGFGPETIATFYRTEGLFELLRRLG